MTEIIETAAQAIQARAGAERLDVAIVLGTGLGSTVESLVAEPIAIPYSEIPGFPTVSVPGHAGRLVIGGAEGLRVACLAGRQHYYERGDAGAMRLAFQTIASLGAKSAILTCSAGSVNADIPPGMLTLVTDHINLTGVTPLIGADPNNFVAMKEAYDRRLIKRMKRASLSGGVPIREGVYMYFPGPSFETPAEIKAARTLGADLIGMSLAPEVVLARAVGWRVAAIAIVTNFGAGFLKGDPSHDQTREAAHQGSIGLKRLLRAFLKTPDEGWEGA